MGFWKTAGKIVWGATKLTAKATATTAGLAAKGAKVTAKAIYDHREAIGSAAAATTKVTAKAAVLTAKAAYGATAVVAKTVYNHKEEIAGVTIGVAQGTVGILYDASGHLITSKETAKQLRILNEQSRRYQEFSSRFAERLREEKRNRAVVFDTLVIGGESLATYALSSHVPEEIQRAYELAYPNIASNYTFAEQVDRLNDEQLVGFVSGVKGKLFELRYIDYLNDGHLPPGFHAELASSPTNPAWDIAIIGPDGSIRDTIQAKATDSVSYVADALKEHPHIDVVTTSEVRSHLVMQGFSERVIDSGISEDTLSAAVDGALGSATASMDWMPSAVSLALIAFSAYTQEGLSAYQKSHEFGKRASKSYLAYLAGGSLAVLTHTWWIGVLAGMGSRLLLGAGRQKREQLFQIKQLVRSNKIVLKRLEKQVR